MKCQACNYDVPTPNLFTKLEGIYKSISGKTYNIFICPSCGTLKACLSKKNDEDHKDPFSGFKCPFCKNTDTREFGITSSIDDIAMSAKKTYAVICSCGARGSHADTEEEAIEKYRCAMEGL